MAKHTLKILQCSHRNIFETCLAIFNIVRERVKIRQDSRYLSHHCLCKNTHTTWNSMQPWKYQYEDCVKYITFITQWTIFQINIFSCMNYIWECWYKCPYIPKLMRCPNGMKFHSFQNRQKYGFSLTRIFSSKDRIMDLVFIGENTGQRKLVFLHFLRSVT